MDEALKKGYALLNLYIVKKKLGLVRKICLLACEIQL